MPDCFGWSVRAPRDCLDMTVLLIERSLMAMGHEDLD